MVLRCVGDRANDVGHYWPLEVTDGLPNSAERGLLTEFDRLGADVANDGYDLGRFAKREESSGEGVVDGLDAGALDLYPCGCRRLALPVLLLFRMPIRLVASRVSLDFQFSEVRNALDSLADQFPRRSDDTASECVPEVVGAVELVLQGQGGVLDM